MNSKYNLMNIINFPIYPYKYSIKGKIRMNQSRIGNLLLITVILIIYYSKLIKNFMLLEFQLILFIIFDKSLRKIKVIQNGIN